MKINSLSSLQVHTAQKTMFSNGNARFSKADNQDVKSMLAQAIPSVIHHKASESFSALPEVPDGTILVYTRPYDPPEAVNARYEEIGTLFTSKLGAASGDLKVAYEDALSQLPPTIKGKDWGFSVNQHNQIVILGRGSSPSGDSTLITSASNSANRREAKGPAIRVPSSSIRTP